MKLNILFLTILFFTLSVHAESPTEQEAWEKICDKVKDVAAPATDQPASDQVKSLKDCDSQASYYGIGQTADYVKARLCAYAEKQAGDGIMFGGDSILMMIYANGYGVTKNIPLAEKFACALEGAPAEMDARTAHLEKLAAATSKSEKAFDLCDDITSGFMMGHCAAKEDRIASNQRNLELKKISEGFADAEKASFAKLQKASKEFTDLRANNEVDLSGTARSAFIVAEIAIQERDFLESLQKLEGKTAPQYTANELREEDAKLNALYKKLQSRKADDGTTITKAGIKATQKAWLIYRDAWIEFAKVRYPGTATESVSAWFTKKRNHMLTSLLHY